MLQLGEEEGDAERAATAAISVLGEAWAAEPLSIRLLLKVARLAATKLGRADRAAEYLQEAAAVLKTLEEAGSISTDDAAEVGGQIGVAAVTLARAEAAFAQPLLSRAVEADRKFAAGRRSLRDAELVYMLAYTHGRTGNRGEAGRLLAETVEIDPQHGDATTMLQRLKPG